MTRDKSKTKQSKTRQNKTKQKQITIPSSVHSILYYIISHDWMHLGKYAVYLNLPLIIGVALFCLHILEGADTACKFGRQSHTESITRAYVIVSD